VIRIDSSKITQAIAVGFAVSSWNLTFTEDGTMNDSHWLISEAE